jgi:hypothetical protein
VQQLRALDNLLIDQARDLEHTMVANRFVSHV